ncbi:MAG: tRNA (adenosine(37)-N6)-threonylcarbamoyltransferase complex dimerization subunit type 1 TsaB [Synergistaceae bacterium]|jgi:tRNA threonylcarbamoyladenosine biosynthesis protein TsaB|nr:tRNA (adenosine(37)-N6)-threonylcarbamoyltransferase complex dimerization subunit type 1 TsaB [Synergistaceae bacterium]
MKDLLLAVDCSLRWTGAAVGRRGVAGPEILAAECLDLGRRQAAELPLMVDRVLEKSGHELEDVGLVAVTNGPGYFTGIRVGVSWAAALAYALKVRVVPVSSLFMLAYPSLQAGRASSEQSPSVLAVVYAGRDRVYAASFGGGDDLRTGEYGQEALKLWLNDHKDVTVTSDDPDRVRAVIGCEATGLPVLKTLPDPAVAARIALQTTELPLSPMELRVSYHRAPQGVSP